MSRYRDVSLNIATSILAVGAVLTAGLRLRQQAQRPEPTRQQYRKIDGWEKFSESGNRMGPAQPAVMIVEFMDFQCPFCRQAAADLHKIRVTFPGEVAVTIRNFPLRGHRFADDAARSAECAAKQGRFEPYTATLFASQASFGRTGWTEFAERSGVADIAGFKACLSEKETTQLVKSDMAAGRELGVTGTPIFLINDREVIGYPGAGQLEELVKSALHSRAQKVKEQRTVAERPRN